MIGKKVTMELRRWTGTPDGMGGETFAYAGLRNITGVLSTTDHYFYIDFPIGETITEADIFVKGTTTYKIIYINNMGHSQGKRLRMTLKEEV